MALSIEIKAIDRTKEAIDSILDNLKKSGKNAVEIAESVNDTIRSSVEDTVNTTNQNLKRAGESVDDLGGKVKGLSASIAGVAGIAWGGMAFLKQMTKVRSEIQNTEASLRVFLGSAQKASSFLQEQGP